MNLFAGDVNIVKANGDMESYLAGIEAYGKSLEAVRGMAVGNWMPPAREGYIKDTDGFTEVVEEMYKDADKFVDDVFN